MEISDEMVEAFGNAFWSVNAASKIDGQREHIRSALEAALSTDAEPVKNEIQKEFAASARAMFLLAANGPDDDLRDGMRELYARMFRVLNGRPPSALSAQVQDVAGWQREHEALGKLIRLFDAEPSIGDAEMAEALEHARCVWDHSHAADGSPASPTSKHGDAD